MYVQVGKYEGTQLINRVWKKEEKEEWKKERMEEMGELNKENNMNIQTEAEGVWHSVLLCWCELLYRSGDSQARCGEEFKQTKPPTPPPHPLPLSGKWNAEMVFSLLAVQIPRYFMYYRCDCKPLAHDYHYHCSPLQYHRGGIWTVQCWVNIAYFMSWICPLAIGTIIKIDHMQITKSENYCILSLHISNWVNQETVFSLSSPTVAEMLV